MKIFKYYNEQWYSIDIENIRKDDIIKIQEDNGKYLPNANNGIISICISDAFIDDKEEWNIKSIPYPFKNIKNNKT